MRYNMILVLVACALLPLAMLSHPPQRDAIAGRIETAAGSSGLKRVAHDLYRDWLNQGAHQHVSFELEARVTYVLVGACDVDCSDVAFELLGPDGASTGVRGYGPQPLLTYEPAKPGTYQLKTTMRQCGIQPCEWGVRVYRR